MGIFRLLWCHVLFAALIDQPFDIAEPDIFPFHAQLQQHVQAGNARRTTAGRDDLDILELFARDTQRIRGGRADDDGGAVLVVVKDGDIHPLAAQLFDDETVGRLDVFEVDRAECGFQRADDIGEFFGVGFIQLDIETVDIGEFLEQDRLAFHHRLRCQRADIAQTQHRRAVCDHGDEVAARGIVARCRRLCLDFQTGLGHAGGIGPRQIAPVGQWLGRPDFQFSGFRKLVIVERGLPQPFLGVLCHPVLSIWFNVKPFSREGLCLIKHGSGRVAIVSAPGDSQRAQDCRTG